MTKAVIGQSEVILNSTPTLNMLISFSSRCFNEESRKSTVAAFSIGKHVTLLHSEVKIVSVFNK